MKPNKVHAVYFSATYTTRKMVRWIAKKIGKNVVEHDITQKRPQEDVILDAQELLVVGMPVYAGRIPATAAADLTKFKGNNTPAIIVCAYGNREYDDALLELNDLVSANGFRVISAAAFIAQHSIFPKVGALRPDAADQQKIEDFAMQSVQKLESIKDLAATPVLNVPGNTPYKEPKGVPLQPTGDKKCDACGICVKLCPTQAIPVADPKSTNKELCISCARCIVVCPQKARKFRGPIYQLASMKFTKANAARKEPVVFFE